jgi:acylphosphatase
MDRAEFIIKGFVQGIGFRYFVARNAQRLSLKGFTMNKGNGEVQVVVEGDCNIIKELLELVRSGHRHAVIEEVSVEWGEAKNEFKSFEIKY